MRYDTIQEISRYDAIQEVEKFNPYHGADGRFTSAGVATSFTYKPGQGKMYDNAIAREKERLAAMGGSPKKGLVAGFGQEHAEAIEKVIDASPEEIKAVWNKFGDEIVVADAHSKGAYCDSGSSNIHVDIDRSANETVKRGTYEEVMHESAHAIDYAIARKLGLSEGFSGSYKDGLFEKTLIQESNAYFKNFQREYQATNGRKISLPEAREIDGYRACSRSLISERHTSDILGGATKGKYTGISGHSKKYWTGWKDYYGDVHGVHKVSTEAFAHFFSTSTTNPQGLARLKSVFPESYKVFTSMMKEAGQ